MEANEVITNLNPLEYDIYFYLIQNKDMIISMKLKDLASQLHVSTAMITRVCQKLGFEGFGEYKAYLKLEEHEHPPSPCCSSLCAAEKGGHRRKRERMRCIY